MGLKNLIFVTQDKINYINKSGMYEINSKDCAKKYVDQTGRSIHTI